MRGWTSKVFLLWITILGRWRRFRTVLSCNIYSMTYRSALIFEFNPTSGRFFACKVNLGLWLHFRIKCNFWRWCFPREWGRRTWTRSGNGVVWFYRCMVRMWRMLLEFSQYILLYDVYIESTAGKVWYKTNEPQLPGITLSHSGGNQKRHRGFSWEALIWMERSWSAYERKCKNEEKSR
jgi:hypothetical protein